MEKTTKIVLGVLVPLAIISGYVFIFKNREPILDLEETDWINDVAKIKFGKNKKSVSLGNNGEMNAGATYSNKYKLEFTSDKKLMVFYVKDKDGYLVDKQTLDFGAKIRY
jgi:hypothetical protein